MRGRTTRHGRIERNRRLNARASLRDVTLVYAAMALVPVLLWLLTNPALAAGLALLVGLVALLMRRGRRIVRGFLRARRAA
ncbi:hypothetical protein MUK72_11555 [Halococcus dombrowskii]|uniref:Uncharacterized protein n=1 Tax=Halococcus dombrowskii TaxID=179637 RepID=A0AAV3SEN7_HALDO|nr:hypothetical protein [Halococcus dombrowskii]UOO94598.1 hypothetical protein MUK72_11555 [Halococcus dombrowskii]